MFNPTSPVTGGAITGLTTPTYTLTADQAPSLFSKQWAVTALGGTQTGVLAHSVDFPFTVTVKRPARLAVLPVKNQVTGQVSRVPVDEYSLIIRKAGSISADQRSVAMIKVIFSQPAGITAYDPASSSALFSLLMGLTTQQGPGLLDTIRSGII